MMTANISPAIILRIREFGEGDLLVGFITPDNGRLKGIAKGARKSRKRFPNCLDLLCLADLEYEIGRRGDLHLLHSCKLVQTFPGLRSDFSSLSLASYMTELTEILFPPGVVDRSVFELFKNSLSLLDKSGTDEALRIHFEARAMALGGYRINLERCSNCGRPYTGEGRAVFVQKKGGIACLKCERETDLSPGLNPGSVKGLRTLQSVTRDEGLADSVSEKMIREIKPVLKLHIEYRIGRRLKTAEYLE
jgi:DNA repair protein RecO (recombination protein O)